MLDEKPLFLMIARILTRCVRLLVALANHVLDIHRKRREPTLTEVVRCRYLEDTAFFFVRRSVGRHQCLAFSLSPGSSAKFPKLVFHSMVTSHVVRLLATFHLA